MAPENLGTDVLVDCDRGVATNKSRPLSIDEIVKEYLLQPAETLENISNEEDEVPNKPISSPSQNGVDGVIEILRRLTLFTTDSELDPLLQKVSKKSIKEDWTKQSDLLSLTFFQKVSSIDYRFSTNTIFMVTVNNKIDIFHKKESVLFLSLHYIPPCFF